MCEVSHRHRSFSFTSEISWFVSNQIRCAALLKGQKAQAQAACGMLSYNRLDLIDQCVIAFHVMPTFTTNSFHAAFRLKVS